MNDVRQLFRIGGKAYEIPKAWAAIDSKDTTEVLQEAIGCYQACRQARANGGRAILEDRKGKQNELLVGD